MNTDPQFIDGLQTGVVITVGIVCAGVALTLTWIALTRFLAMGESDDDPPQENRCNNSQEK
jgi:hypothetical protein